MTNIVPLNAEGALPSHIVNRKRLLDVNKDLVIAAQFPTLSIKGKVFTLVKDSERKVLTKPDDPEEVVQSVNAVPLRISFGHKTYYSKEYSDEDSEGIRPDCFSNDGITPDPSSPNKQAEKCALCPKNQWGSSERKGGTGKGKACSDNARLAIADPRYLEKPMLLRVPPASLKHLKDELKKVKGRGLQYNEVIFRIGFVREEASPTLSFRAVGVLDDASYEKSCEMFENEVVQSIVGIGDQPTQAPAPAPAAVSDDELDAALAAREATRKAAKPAPAPAAVSDAELDSVLGAPAAPAPAPTKPKAAAAKPKAAPAPAPAAEPEASTGGDLLGDIEDILGGLPQDD